MSEPTKPAPQKQIAPIELMQKDLDAQQEQFKLVLPSHITPERFTRVALTALQRTPSLLTSDRKTLISELMLCATDGLQPDGREAAIVPYKGKAKYMPMIFGIVKRLHQAGGVKSITNNVVFENDEFQYYIDESGEHLKHKPKLDGPRGKEILTYSMISTLNGGHFIEVITEEDMDLIRKASPGTNTPWNGDFVDEMRKKSALRRNSKKMPLGNELIDLIRRDDDFYDFTTPQPSADNLPPMTPQSLGDELPPDAPPQPQGKMKDVNSSEPKQVYNHAPGAVNHPDAKPSTPPPTKKMDSRPRLAKEFWALCKELAIDPAQKIGEIFQKDAAKLTEDEYINLIDLIKADKIKGEI